MTDASVERGAVDAATLQRLATEDPFGPLVVDRDSSRADTATPPESPARIFWRHLKKSPIAIVGGGLLLVFYALAIVAPFVAPYSEEEMDRRRYFHPPHDLHYVDAGGRLHLRPFIRQTALTNPSAFKYEEVPGQERPVRFFVRGSEYTILGLFRSNIHPSGGTTTASTCSAPTRSAATSSRACCSAARCRSRSAWSASSSRSR